MTQIKKLNTAETFINPAGFIEQSYKGYQSADSVKASVGKLQQCLRTMRRQRKPVLILIDITQLTGTSAASRKVGLEGIRSVPYDKAAMYGPLWTQVLVNTLALIAGKSHKVRAFDSRSEAVRWLKTKR